MSHKDKKQSTINEIKQNMAEASSIVLVNSRGLTVAQDSMLRKELREGGVKYKVYKNTLLDIAIEGGKFADIKEQLSGPTAVAFSYDDATAAARIINKQIKDMPKLMFKGGIVEDVLYDDEGITKIAKIPAREELLSKLLGSFKAPMSTFVRLVSAIAEKKAEESTEEVAAETAEEPVAEEPVVEEKAAEETVAEEPVVEEPVVEEPVAEETAAEETDEN